MAIIEKKLTAETQEELEKKVDWYFNRYHPLGYMTMEHKRGEMLDQDGNTVYYSKISRLSSCD